MGWGRPSHSGVMRSPTLASRRSADSSNPGPHPFKSSGASLLRVLSQGLYPARWHEEGRDWPWPHGVRTPGLRPQAVLSHPALSAQASRQKVALGASRQEAPSRAHTEGSTGEAPLTRIPSGLSASFFRFHDAEEGTQGCTWQTSAGSLILTHSLSTLSEASVPV